MTEPLISLDNISFKINNNYILKNVSSHIKHGKPTAIMGMNGAGKTTLLKILAGIYKPSQGNIYSYLDKSVQHGISFLFQQHIFLDRSVMENLLHSLKCVDGDDRVNNILKVKEYLTKFHLIKYLDTHINKLSSGEKQLISIIRTILIDADILFLDEPFNYLDRYYLDFTKKIFKDLSKTKKIILITHSKDEAMHFTDDVLILKDGSIQ